jgi:hypothetical protein
MSTVHNPLVAEDFVVLTTLLIANKSRSRNIGDLPIPRHTVCRTHLLGLMAFGTEKNSGFVTIEDRKTSGD